MNVLKCLNLRIRENFYFLILFNEIKFTCGIKIFYKVIYNKEDINIKIYLYVNEYKTIIYFQNYNYNYNSLKIRNFNRAELLDTWCGIFFIQNKFITDRVRLYNCKEK